MIEIIDAKDVRYKPVFSHLVELYLYQLSKELQFDVADNGLFGDDDVADIWDGTWKDKFNRHPFLLKVEGKIAGFAVIDELMLLNGDKGYEVGEFFVMARYSGRGIGREVAVKLFERFKGSWQVRELHNNKSAIHFWRRVIGVYTNDEYKEDSVDNDQWHGPVQFFKN